jgi:prepilin-type processing-associated H-X9-DG protein
MGAIKKAAKKVPPAIIFWFMLWVIAGFLYLRFPYIHPHRQFTRELFVYGNLAACVFFLSSLISGFGKKFCYSSLITLLFLLLGMFSLVMQLLLDHFRLDTHLGGQILLSAAAILGVLAASAALLGYFFGRSLHDSLLSTGVLLLLCINLVIPEFTRPYGYKAQLCRTYIRTLWSAFQFYKDDNGQWPDAAQWCDRIVQKFDVNPQYMRCPYDKSDLCSYALNENIPADANDLPPNLVLLFESAPGWNQVGGPGDVVTDRHDKNNPGANIAFADGHVEFVPADKIPTLRWTITIESPPAVLNE